MNNKVALESMSMDLLRVALGLHRGSYKMATRFFEEALKRKNEVESDKLRPYIVKILNKIESHDKENLTKFADDFLMYSVLIQNYTRKFLH